VTVLGPHVAFVTRYLRAFALCFASNDISASLVSAAAEF
jgi:hypothetical protein